MLDIVAHGCVVAASTVQDQVIARGSGTLSDDGISGNFANCAPRVHFS